MVTVRPASVLLIFWNLVPTSLGRWESKRGLQHREHQKWVFIHISTCEIMCHRFQAAMPEMAGKIKFYIGDVRDLQSCKNAMHSVGCIFHAVALKQVPSCEFFPMEAVRTNVIDTDNVLTAAIEAGVECVICLSTDKAAYPINAMGITKAVEEKVAVAKSRYSGKTKLCCTRYGNVMCSRGSVNRSCFM